jgi:hypothetical protein
VLEDEVLVQSEPTATTNLNLDLLALDKSLEMTIARGKVSEASPQLVIQLGPCGPLENQLVPMGLSLSQARFLSWAAIMHPKDSLKPNIVPFSGEIRDISEESPMVVDRGKGKRSFEEKVETEGKLNKKMKLEPVGKFKQVAKTSPIRKIAESKRVRELKKIARDKEGRKKIAMFASGSISPISIPTDTEAEEAGLTMPPPPPRIMLVLAWNCRGMARPTTIRKLKALVCSFNPSCIFLQETILDVSKVVVIVERLGFLKHYIIPSVGIAGGLCLAWKEEIELEVTMANQNIINALIFLEPQNQPWMISLVHAPSNQYGRIPFWEHLQTIGDSFVGPWLCAGDFNCVVSQAEKKGGLPVGEASRSKL